SRQEDALLDMKERVIDPIRKFMSGPQKQIFDEAKVLVQEQAPNFDYVEGNEASELKSYLADSDCFRGNRIQQMKAASDALKSRIQEVLQNTRTTAVASLRAMQARMQSMD